MRFDLSDLDPLLSYRLLSSLIVPRPIALVTTIDDNGAVNAAPFSFFNMLGNNPPVVALGIGRDSQGRFKDTMANLTARQECVVNIVTEDMATAMNVCGIDFPTGENEMSAAGLTPLPSQRVAPPGVAESPAQLECRLSQIVEIGNNRIALSEVVYLTVKDSAIDRDTLRLHTDAMRIIGRMHGGGWYTRTSELFDLPRISYQDWRQKDSGPETTKADS